ncbi:hypothetical protein LCGC14_1517410, partial [marine sediment metagenome]
MGLAESFVAEAAVYGRKPPKPTSVWLLTRYIQERSTDSKVKVIDMGKGQEYEFRYGEADQWPKEARYTGNTQLKQSSWEGWWRLYLARRRKYHSKPDGKYVDPLGEAVKKALPMDFETFATKRGGSRQDYGEPGAHKRSRRQSDKQWSRIIKHLMQKDDELDTRRVDLRKQYAALVKQGVLRPLTRMEKLKATAAGHPDNPSVQAARRVLKKQGVPFETPLDESWEDADELFGEADEPGQGEEPADSKLAQTLARSFLKKKSALALPFRQLWRHKYVKKNYNADEAWKLFYW